MTVNQEDGKFVKTDDSGQRWVLMAYRQPTDKQVFVNGHGYSFTTYYCSCAWVMESDVPAILDVKKVCCGGRVNHEFMIANEGQYGIWIKMP